MPKTRRVRCPYCGFLYVIKWGKQCGHQRYKCKNCDSFFTHRREDISKRNRFVWFKSWVRGKQTREDITEKSCYSVRQLKYWGSLHFVYTMFSNEFRHLEEEIHIFVESLKRIRYV